MVHYFTVDPAKISFREFWNLSPGLNGVVAWLLSKLRLLKTLGDGTIIPERISELRVDPALIPEDAHDRLRPFLVESEAVGFYGPVYHRLVSSRHLTESFMVSMLHSSGAAMIRHFYTVSRATNPPTRKCHSAIITPTREGAFLVSTGAKPGFRTAPGVEIVRLAGAGTPRVWELHQKALALFRLKHLIPEMRTQVDCEVLADLYEARTREFLEGRGVFRRMTTEEIASDQAHVETKRLVAETMGEENALQLAALSDLLNPKPRWTNAALLLAVSLVAFVSVGATQWSWDSVAIIVGVLFVHELGHYAMMRLFNYQNLKMFFIPFFGAAVSGRNFNVKGWQKALVSLMGPMPGILIGTSLAILGGLADHPLVSRVGFITVLINGINLLPVLPLDGGWYLNAILFCRNVWFEISFRVLAVIVLIGYSLQSGQALWRYIGLAMAVSLPQSIRIARITHRLRAEGVAAESPDQKSVPAGIAVAIFKELDATSKRPEALKTRAVFALNIFESLNAVPPSWLGTVGLLALYLGVLGIAFLGCGVGGWLRPGGGSVESLLRIPEPHHHFVCGQYEAADGRAAASYSGEDQIIVSGSFTNRETAQKAFASLQESGDARTLTLFGESVMGFGMESSSGRAAEWERQIRDLGGEAVIQQPRSNHVATVHVSARFASNAEATSVRRELEGYWNNRRDNLLLAPWMHLPGDPLQVLKIQASGRRARQTALRLRELKSATERAPQVNALRRQYFDRLLAEGTGAVAQVHLEQIRLVARLNAEAFARLRARPEPDQDEGMIDLELRRPDRDRDPKAYQEWDRTRTDRMGTLPLIDGRVIDAFRELQATGMVRQRRTRLELGWIEFERIDRGLPALADWLCSLGAKDIRYQIMGSDPDVSDADSK